MTNNEMTTVLTGMRSTLRKVIDGLQDRGEEGDGLPYALLTEAHDLITQARAAIHNQENP